MGLGLDVSMPLQLHVRLYSPSVPQASAYIVYQNGGSAASSTAIPSNGLRLWRVMHSSVLVSVYM